MNLRNAFLLLMLGVASGSCGGSNSKAAAQDAPKEESRLPTHLQMQAHFVEVSRVQDALVRGELSEAKRAALELANSPQPSNLPSDWRPYYDNMRVAAKEVSVAPTVENAALSAVKMAEACGSCHSALAVELDLSKEPVPMGEGDGDTSVAVYMLRHQWAAARMWDALVAPSDDEWKRGASVLAESTEAARQQQDGSLTDEMKRLADELIVLSKNAQEPGAARGEIYGRFLGTCARCHESFLGSVD